MLKYKVKNKNQKMSNTEQKRKDEPVSAEKEMVVTKDLSYSYIRLMPNDKTESSIFLQSRLDEISDLYIYFLILLLIGNIAIGIPKAYNNPDVATISLVLANFTVLIIRTVAFLRNKQNPNLFRAHLVACFMFICFENLLEPYLELK